MKIQFIILMLFTFLIQSCFTYDNTISWEDASKIKHYDSRDGGDTSKLKLRVDLERTNRNFFLPFVYFEIHKKKPIYSPVIEMVCRDQSILKFYDFSLKILSLDGVNLFNKSYNDTVTLNSFDDFGYNAIQHAYKSDFIPNLEGIDDAVLLDFKLKTIDSLGRIDSISFSNIKYVKTNYKKFSSFL